MALNSSSAENAILGIEIDDHGAFDKLDQRVAVSTANINKQFTLSGNSSAKSFASIGDTARAKLKLAEDAAKRAGEAAAKAAKDAEVNWKKVGVQMAAFVMAASKTFDVVKAGGGEAAERIVALEGKFEELRASVGRAAGETHRFQESLALLETVTTGARGVTAAFDAMPQGVSHAVAAVQSFARLAQNALGPVMFMLSEIRRMRGMYREAVTRASDERAGMEGAEQQAGDNQRANTRAWQRIAENTRAAERARVAADNAATAGITAKVAEGFKHRRGGGGGAASRKHTNADRADANMERMRRLDELATQIAERGGRERVEILASVTDQIVEQGQREFASRMRANELLTQQEKEAFNLRILQANEESEHRKRLQQGISTYTQATMQAAMAAALQGKGFVGIMRAGLSAIGTLAAARALFEAAEAVAWLFVPGGQVAAAGHAKAAAMFGGLALGATAMGKVAFGSDYGRASNGRRGGGGVGDAIAAPRGSGGGGGGTQKIEETFIIRTSGDILDSDRGLRRLARHIRDTGRRDY